MWKEEGSPGGSKYHGCGIFTLEKERMGGRKKGTKERMKEGSIQSYIRKDRRKECGRKKDPLEGVTFMVVENI